MKKGYESTVPRTVRPLSTPWAYMQSLICRFFDSLSANCGTPEGRAQCRLCHISFILPPGAQSPDSQNAAARLGIRWALPRGHQRNNHELVGLYIIDFCSVNVLDRCLVFLLISMGRMASLGPVLKRRDGRNATSWNSDHRDGGAVAAPGSPARRTDRQSQRAGSPRHPLRPNQPGICEPVAPAGPEYVEAPGAIPESATNGSCASYGHWPGFIVMVRPGTGKAALSTPRGIEEMHR